MLKRTMRMMLLAAVLCGLIVPGAAAAHELRFLRYEHEGLADEYLLEDGFSYLVRPSSVKRVLEDGSLELLIDESGDGLGNPLAGIPGFSDAPIVVDDAGNVFVVGYDSHTVFRVAPDGRIDLMSDEDGLGVHPALRPLNPTFERDGFVYFRANFWETLFRVGEPGEIEVVYEAPDGMFIRSYAVRRNGAVVMLLPGFGEAYVSPRVRLLFALVLFFNTLQLTVVISSARRRSIRVWNDSRPSRSHSTA